MPAPRQTISFLQQRFREVGLQPDKKHGQNFLIDINLIDLLIRAADLGPDDVVLEIGTGTGSLTARMADQAGHVVTVEIDQHLYLLSSEELIDYTNVTQLHQDALKNKNNLSETVLQTVRDKLAEVPGRQFKLAANLPYNVATPILSNLLSTDITPVSMTATIQRELAERIIASPRTKDYSALSIWMQALCEVEIVRIMPPDVFWPRPKVDSAIIHIVPKPEKRAQIPDLTYFHNFVRSLFFHRRKFLRSVLVAAFKDRLEKPDIDAIMAQHNFGPTTRAEELDVPTIQALCETCRQAEIAKGITTEAQRHGGEEGEEK
jgi:16S rRNA (adenine1518-N6/adenine1519-N6)-dimethyltransferase